VQARGVELALTHIFWHVVSPIARIMCARTRNVKGPSAPISLGLQSVGFFGEPPARSRPISELLGKFAVRDMGNEKAVVQGSYEGALLALEDTDLWPVVMRPYAS